MTRINNNPFLYKTNGQAQVNEMTDNCNVEQTSRQYNVSNDFTDENSYAQFGTISTPCGELNQEEVELIKKELKRKIEEMKDDLGDKKSNRGWLTSAWNGICSVFGGGDKKTENKIAEYEKLLSSLETDPTQIDEVYKTIMGVDLDVNSLSALQTSKQIANSLTNEQNQMIIANLEAQIEELEANFEKTKNSNGWISGTWDALKNWTGIGASSNKTASEIADLKEQVALLKEGKADLATVYKNISGADLNIENLNAMLSDEEGAGLQNLSKAGDSVNKYAEGQKMCTDIVADIVSGVAAVLISTVAVAAAPFTGGASLLLGAAVGAGVGMIVKPAIKASDCIGNEKEYTAKDLGYDVLTGALNGAAAPLTNAAGGAAGTAVMKALGCEALETTVKTTGKVVVKEVAEEAVEQTVKQTGKQAFKQGVIKVAGFTANAMVDGGLSGFVDGSSRALGEGRYEDILSDGTQGLVGGMIASPIIGGGFVAAGKLGSTIGNKITNKVGNEVAQEAGEKVGNEIGQEASEEVGQVIGKETGEELAGQTVEHISKKTNEIISKIDMSSLTEEEKIQLILSKSQNIDEFSAVEIAQYSDAEYEKIIELLDKHPELNGKVVKKLISNDYSAEQYDKAIMFINQYGLELDKAIKLAGVPEEKPIYKKVINLLDMGIEGDSAFTIAKLGQEQYDAVINLVNDGIDAKNASNIVRAELNDEQYKMAITLAKQGVDSNSAIGIAKRGQEQYDAVINLVNDGIDAKNASNIVRAELNDEQYKMAITLAKQGVDSNSAIEIARAGLNDEQYEMAIEYARKNLNPKEIIKILRGETYNKEQIELINNLLDKLNSEIKGDYQVTPMVLQNNAGIVLVAKKEFASLDNAEIKITKRVTINENGLITKSTVETNGETSRTWYFGGDKITIIESQIGHNYNYTYINDQIEIVNGPSGEPSYIIHTKASKNLAGAYETTKYVLADYPEDFDILTHIQNGTIDDAIAKSGYPQGARTSSVVQNLDGSTTYTEKHVRNGNIVDRNYTQNVDANGNINSYDYTYNIQGKNGESLLDLHRSWAQNPDGTTTTIINGQKYTASFDDANFEITITKPDGSRQILTLQDKFKNLNEAKKFYIFAKTVPADDLLTIQNNISAISLLSSSSYIPEGKELHIVPSKSVLSHELGHSLDFPDGQICIGEISGNQELIDVYNREMELFKKDYPEFIQANIKYFSQEGGSRGNGLTEFVAETNTLLKTYGFSDITHCTRCEYLARYFPETIAKIAKLLGY